MGTDRPDSEYAFEKFESSLDRFGNKPAIGKVMVPLDVLPKAAS